MRKAEFYDIPSNTKKGKVYSVILIFEDGKLSERSSCTCLKGSFYRYRKKETDWRCSHIYCALYKKQEKEAK